MPALICRFRSSVPTNCGDSNVRAHTYPVSTRHTRSLWPRLCDLGSCIRRIAMRAVLCRSFNGPEELGIGEMEEPKPAADEILIDVHAASVSFMDYLIVS